MRLRFALFKFYIGRLYSVITGNQKYLVILRAYELKGDELIKLAEKANGLCIRDF